MSWVRREDFSNRSGRLVEMHLAIAEQNGESPNGSRSPGIRGRLGCRLRFAIPHRFLIRVLGSCRTGFKRAIREGPPARARPKRALSASNVVDERAGRSSFGELSQSRSEAP